MRLFAKMILVAGMLNLGALGLSCAFSKHRPCTDGGDPARVPATGGTKQCETMDDATGRAVNHGHYREWFTNGRLAIEGDYRMGKKHGKWTEWDESGKRLYEKFYEDGIETPRFDAAPKKP